MSVISRPVFFSRGSIFDAKNRKVCNIPQQAQREDAELLAAELVYLINSTDDFVTDKTYDKNQLTLEL